MTNLINELKKLKSIKADEGFKFDLRKKILGGLGSAVTKQTPERLLNQRALSSSQLLINLFFRKKMFIPLILIAALLGTGAGTTYASQDSLPGDILYLVKIIAEKAQTALVFNNVKEAELYSKFASKRLEEIEKLAEAEKINLELAQKAIDYYKKDLSASQNILNAAPTFDQSAKIAKALSDAASQNKIIMVNISKKIKKHKDNEIYDILKDAWEEAEEHNDTIALALLANLRIPTDTQLLSLTAIDLSSTNTTAIDTAINTTNLSDVSTGLLARNNVLRKIAEANHKISEAEKYIVKKELQGIDVSAAKTQIASAKALVVEAQNLLNQQKYQEAFLKAKEAHQTAKFAKKSAEQKTEDHDDEYSDEEDDEEIFVIPALNDIYGDNDDDDDYFDKEIKDRKEKHENKGRKNEKDKKDEDDD